MTRTRLTRRSRFLYYTLSDVNPDPFRVPFPRNFTRARPYAGDRKRAVLLYSLRMDSYLLAKLKCPRCPNGPLIAREPGRIVCESCGRIYPINDGVPDLLPDSGDGGKAIADRTADIPMANTKT